VKNIIRAGLFPVIALLTGVACSPADDKAANSSADSAPAVAEATQPAAMPRTASGEGASVFFVSPADGDTVSSPFAVEFGISTMAVVRAGDNTPNTGHHHVLIDTGLPALDMPIPADEHHVHFGDGSSATELTLAPGEHTLQLLLGDYLHIPHEPPVYSQRITVTVE
jgi:hypothetical protein